MDTQDVAYGSPAITATVDSGRAAQINVAPFISSLGIEKDMGTSAGAWEMEIPYASDRTSRLLDAIMPNDYVSLSLATRAGDPRVARCRGFVDNVSLQEGTDDEGRPTRTIILNGRDYDKIVQQFKIYYPLSSADIPTALLRTLSLTLKYGLVQSALNLTPNTFVQEVFSKVLSAGFVEPLRATNRAIAPLQLHTAVPPQFGYDTLSIQSFMGSFDGLFRQYQSPPWGEYFIRDDDDAPRLYVRPAPFYAADGAFCWQSAAREDVRYVLVPGVEVKEGNLHTSDDEVFTYFFTAAAGLGLSPELSKAVGIDGTQNPYYDGVFNPHRVQRFGFRPLTPDSPWVPLDLKTGGPAGGQAALDLQTTLNGWLVRAFGYGEYLRNGQIVCRGVQGARIGDYLYYERTGEIYYVQGMAIEWHEGSALQSTYQVIRGQVVPRVRPSALGGTPVVARPVFALAPPPAELVRYAPGTRAA